MSKIKPNQLSESKVGCAVISDNHSNMQRIPDDSSIFTAEAKAVDLALDFISTRDANNTFIIFSDSLSVLKAMNHTSSKNPQIQKLLEKCHELLAYKESVLCWIPSHIGIQGNEMVDKQVKTLLSLEPTSFKIPFSNFKPSINKYILFDLHSGKKSESNPHILKDDFRKMQSRYKNYQQIYTDGSKEDSKVGCAVISDNHSNMQRIPDDSSIFTAEAKAIDLALDFISTCDANNKFIIFSDSLSVLKAMNHTSSKNPQIQKLLEKCHELLAYKEIALCWIPSHIGIQGNEMVDKQAKTSLSLEPTSFKIPFSNFKPSINKYILEEWQTSWNNSIGNKLLDIKPTIGEYQSVVRNIRREEVVLARLRLGHTRVTHSYLLQGEELPQCVGCDAPFTVRHFLLECGDFAQVRNNCFHVDNMKELFQDIHIDSIMTFLRQINLFNKI